MNQTDRRYCKYCHEDVRVGLFFEQVRGVPTVQVACGVCRYGLDPPVELREVADLVAEREKRRAATEMGQG